MNPQRQVYGAASTALLVSLTYVPLLLSILTFYPQLFTTQPSQRFLLSMAPWWMAYLSAKWYVRLAERSSPLYHPMGCLAQCCVWVFHWVVSLYHVYFAPSYTLWAYLITVFCVAIVILTEGMFHGLIAVDVSDRSHLGVYEKVRKIYGRGLVVLVKLWYLVDLEIPETQDRSRKRRPMGSRSMTL